MSKPLSPPDFEAIAHDSAPAPSGSKQHLATLSVWLVDVLIMVAVIALGIFIGA